MEFDGKFQHVSKPKYDCLLFDIDDTIYPFSSGLSPLITKNIQEYMLEKLNMEASKVPELCISLYKDYGTTMAGLRAIGYNFDYDDFHGFVHGRLPYNEMLKPDPVLRNLLRSLPIRKVIFTNGDERHAAKVLARMGLEDCFDGIICFETLNPISNGEGPVDVDEPKPEDGADINLPRTPVVCKPNTEAFEQAFKLANINPQTTLFFDDSVRNLQTGKQLGLHTVLVGSSHRSECADYALETLHNIKEAFPELWEVDNERPENVSYAEEIYVRA